MDQVIRFDGPIFDSSITTFQFCKYVRSKAKVFLGGDGGDELLVAIQTIVIFKDFTFLHDSSYLDKLGNLYLSKFNFTRYRNWVDAVSSTSSLVQLNQNNSLIIKYLSNNLNLISLMKLYF